MEQEGGVLQKGQNRQIGSCRKFHQEVYTAIGGHNKELVTCSKKIKN